MTQDPFGQPQGLWDLQVKSGLGQGEGCALRTPGANNGTARDVS